MHPVRRILVAVKDPQARSLPAVHKATQIARGLKAQLTLFHDIATPLYADLLHDRPAGLQAAQREIQSARRAPLERLAARIRRHGIDVDVSADWDYPPAEAIVRKALRVGADLLVVENHHGTGRHPARWLLSYTDWELLRLSPIPVLLVKNRKLYHRPRVLAAVDPLHAYAKPGNLDRLILRTSAQLVHALQGELHAVHAFNPMPLLSPTLPEGPPVDPYPDREEQQRSVSRELATLVEAFDVKPSHCQLVHGPAREVIPDTARRERAAILAMGVVSRSGLKRWFIGNTAESVMDAVTADVLVVKPASFRCKVPRSGRGARILSLPLLPA